VTINGPLSAGMFQIFALTGTGVVVLGPNSANQIYPEWWGCVVDDDTVAAANSLAIQSALTQSWTSGGCVVIGIGTYYYNTTLTMTSNTLLRGSSNASSILSYTGAGSAIEGDPGTRTYSHQIENLAISTETGSVGIDFTDVSSSTIRNVLVSDFSTYGIKLAHSGSSVQAWCTYNRLYNVNVDGKADTTGSSCFYVELGCNANLFYGCRARQYGATAYGFYVSGGNDNTIFGSQIESPATSPSATGLFLDAASDHQILYFRIIANRFEGDGTVITIGDDTYVKYLTIIGNYIGLGSTGITGVGDRTEIINPPAPSDKIRVLSTTAVNFHIVEATTLYTVPAGRVCVPTSVILRGGVMGTASVSFGFNSATYDNVIADTTYASVNGITKYQEVFPKAGAVLGAATEDFKIRVNSSAEDVMISVDVLGYLFYS
jgi:hypothetical protein